MGSQQLQRPRQVKSYSADTTNMQPAAASQKAPLYFCYQRRDESVRDVPEQGTEQSLRVPLVAD